MLLLKRMDVLSILMMFLYVVAVVLVLLYVRLVLLQSKKMNMDFKGV